jgi:hypothetical protein
MEQYFGVLIYQCCVNPPRPPPPFRPIFSSCVNKLTFSGLSGSDTPANAALALTSRSHVAKFGATANWAQTGTLKVDMTVVGDDANKVLRGCENHGFSFALQNSRTPQDARVVTLSVDGVLSPTLITDGGGSDSTEPLKIADIGWSVKTIQDNSNYPCGMNQISVMLSPTIDIRQGPECVQYLEIVVFVGTLQADSSTLQVTSASAGVFNADATWDKTLGRIKVYLNAALYAGTPYAFSFSIRNSATPSVSGVTVTISVPQISSTLSTMDIQGTGLLDIMSSSWTTAVISQTSNWPCAQNIIAVSIVASIDVDKESA